MEVYLWTSLGDWRHTRLSHPFPPAAALLHHPELPARPFPWNLNSRSCDAPASSFSPSAHSSVGNADIDVAYTKTLILLEAELLLWELISKWPTGHPSTTQVLHSLPCTSVKSVILSEAEFEGAYQGYSPHSCDHQSDTSPRRGVSYYQLTR